MGHLNACQADHANANFFPQTTRGRYVSIVLVPHNMIMSVFIRFDSRCDGPTVDRCRMDVVLCEKKATYIHTLVAAMRQSRQQNFKKLILSANRGARTDERNFLT